MCSVPALSLLLFFAIERSVLMALVLHNKGILEKVTMQKNPAILGFFNIERIGRYKTQVTGPGYRSRSQVTGHRSQRRGATFIDTWFAK